MAIDLGVLGLVRGHADRVRLLLGTATESLPTEQDVVAQGAVAEEDEEAKDHESSAVEVHEDG